MKRKGYKFLRFFKLLSPKYLAGEVHVYGYHFSWKKHLLALVCSLAGISGIGLLFQLESAYFSMILLAVCFTLPIFILSAYKRMYEQKRFADATSYAEQILYSFQKNGKVVSALKETREIFEEGRMRWTLDEAIAYIEKGRASSEKGVLRETLEIIENAYANEKIHLVHEFLINSEEYGGDAEDTIPLMLNEIELWKRRGYKLQADKKISHTDNVISVFVATLLCAVALYVLAGMGSLFPKAEGVDIFAVPAIQISSFVFILFLLYVLVKIVRSFQTNWLKNEAVYSEESLLSSYKLVMDCGKKRKKRRFVLGYALAQKDVKEELYMELPQWLMEIALLLQNNNVQVSIHKSMENAPVLLKKELELLIERLREEPEQLQSYTNFCQGFDIPEAQSCMKMLYAISESGTGNAKVQIHNLMKRVHEMQNLADDIRAKNEAFKMKMIFSYPVLAATAKLLIDLTVGMFYMFQLIGNMGTGGVM